MPDPLGGVQALLHQPLEHGPGRPRLVRHPVGLLDLAQDLRFAEDHRIHSGRDLEQVAYGVEVDAMVDVPVELRLAHAARRSVPAAANRHVYSSPSGERRARVQSPQNGWLIEAIKPTSPWPSLYR